MKIEEFLQDRILEESSLSRIPLSVLNYMTKVLEFQKNWPILVRGPVQTETRLDGDVLTLSFVEEMVWLTEQAYVQKFGTNPPTAPLIRAMAEIWREHPEWQKEWD